MTSIVTRADIPYVLRCAECHTDEGVRIRRVGYWLSALHRYVTQSIPLCDTCFKELSNQ